MRTRSIVLALAVCFPLAQARADDPPAFARELPKIKTGKPVLEFNGKDLTGFYTYQKGTGREDPDHVFTVKDGVIHVSGQHFGGFITREEYHDYHLVAEWKWGDRTYAPRKTSARDSGILLHCVGADGAAGGVWMESIECQIIEGGCGDFILVAGENKPTMTCEAKQVGRELVFEPGASPITRDSARFNWWGRDPQWKDKVGFRGGRDVEKPAGEWNRMEVICDGGSITNIVNGYVVNAGTGSSLKAGKILFQSEGAEILFRKIEVRPLVK